jgi:Co/Zn/Cd efflux system component
MTTVPIFIDCVRIVMEATPKQEDIDTVNLYNDILRLNTVEEIHDFHCWQLAGGKYILTCHVRSEFGDKVIRDINRICKSKQYGVFHTTIQVERERRDALVISCDHNA